MRLLTVLVIDIRNFTGLTMELGESKTSEMMGSLFHAAGVVLTRNGSYAQKYIGDAVMAVWVHDSDRPVQKDLLSIFHALCGLAGIIGGLQAQFVLRAPSVSAPAVNSGVAALGNLGSAGLADHTAMGECVNKAFPWRPPPRNSAWTSSSAAIRSVSSTPSPTSVESSSRRLRTSKATARRSRSRDQPGANPAGSGKDPHHILG